MARQAGPCGFRCRFCIRRRLCPFRWGAGIPAFCGSSGSLARTGSVIAVAAFLLPLRRGSQPPDNRPAPSPSIAGGAAFVLTGAFMGLTRLSHDLRLPAAVPDLVLLPALRTGGVSRLALVEAGWL